MASKLPKFPRCSIRKKEYFKRFQIVDLSVLKLQQNNQIDSPVQRLCYRKNPNEVISKLI
jgi:hypothetical protein